MVGGQLATLARLYTGPWSHTQVNPFTIQHFFTPNSQFTILNWGSHGHTLKSTHSQSPIQLFFTQLQCIDNWHSFGKQPFSTLIYTLFTLPLVESPLAPHSHTLKSTQSQFPRGAIQLFFTSKELLAEVLTESRSKTPIGKRHSFEKQPFFDINLQTFYLILG